MWVNFGRYRNGRCWYFLGSFLSIFRLNGIFLQFGTFWVLCAEKIWQPCYFHESKQENFVFFLNKVEKFKPLIPGTQGNSDTYPTRV
jgi:hypothetical protein